MSGRDEPVSPRQVAATAVLADLPLSEERAGAVATLLSSWLPAANALSARMRAEELRGLAPATVFTQGPVTHEVDEE